MKKIKSILMALSLICFTAISYAQQQVQQLNMLAQKDNGAIVVRDTTVNTDTSFIVLDTLHSGSGTTGGAITTYGDVIYAWTVVPSVTGTTSGTIYFQGSMSGTFATLTAVGDWVPLISDVTQYNGSSSISISGTTPVSGYFILPKNEFKVVRIVYRTTGTQTSYVTCKAFLRQHG